jgi:hypothetical protein
LDCPTGLKRRIERKREFLKLSNRNREEKRGLMPNNQATCSPDASVTRGRHLGISARSSGSMGSKR